MKLTIFCGSKHSQIPKGARHFVFMSWAHECRKHRMMLIGQNPRSNRKSSVRYCTMVCGNLVSWKSKKQTVVIQSSSGRVSGYCVIVENIIEELGFKQGQPMILHCDNILVIDQWHDEESYESHKGSPYQHKEDCKRKCPFQVLCPSTSMFSVPPKVFGCTCFVHVLRQQGDKLDSKAI